ncbi:cobalamin biosynthesis protein [Actinocorallia sp. A-T 12471]|uniref:cobalamin biosynthesis protein n=1 Tax=Actinocorallia sp. A-T 12471 TaxID=3089813 RepID=UPI0029D35189|nr:cobalamin biosynthesis protein [Actinocorallia sp. A-T 12471]MDX6742863.1 cobalamin biosynthesis protein [Actinocorallia sp. A-T 12471]
MLRTGTTARAAGLLLGAGLDALLGDPRRGHPVAGFGRAAAALEKALYGDDRARGAVFAGVCAGSVLGLAVLAERAGRDRPLLRCATTAVTTWAVLGGTSLAREGEVMARHLEAGSLGAARLRLSHLCARDPSGLDAPALARATVESLAENTGDAVVSPLFWGAVAGVPGLAVYRALNTLDAMVGYRSPRYANFGWAAAKLDDAANYPPARLTALLTVLTAPTLPGAGAGWGRGKAAGEAWRVLWRDGGRHPSPNAGRCEAAAAGALGVRLGGTNRYAGGVETRPTLGDGRDPEVSDIRRAVRLTRAVSVSAVVAAVGLTFALGRVGGRR